jgi:hypothetical protein
VADDRRCEGLSRVGKEFIGHRGVHHSLGEYVDSEDAIVHTNTYEAYFGVSERGLRDIYQHAARSTFIASLPSLISDIIVGCGLGSATRRGPAGLFSAPRGSD